MVTAENWSKWTLAMAWSAFSSLFCGSLCPILCFTVIIAGVMRSIKKMEMEALARTIMVMFEQVGLLHTRSRFIFLLLGLCLTLGSQKI